MMKASIIGGSGYVGGELLRLLLDHPFIEIGQVTSTSHLGEYVYQQHPNLRTRSMLKFTAPDAVEECDILYLASPHGISQKNINAYAKLAPRIIDLSADFRINDPQLYKHYYGHDHLAPEWMSRFVYGLAELHRDDLRNANYVSGVGCNATAANLALYPLVRSGLLDVQQPVIVDIKVGSSEAGASPNAGSHHPERSNVVHLTMTSVDLVRGALAAAHAFVLPGVTEKQLWGAYRDWSSTEPFVRLVKDRRGIYRVPEPKILAGSNYVDVGFEFDPVHQRVVSMAAIDNLMKGAAGSAVQSMNLMCGFDETAGLTFPGLHPI
jgi:LysW-gamma-L-alpha-aminoadipyl-6-phosphate/LysW-L-glutamyl-5-phosphate reductase